MSAATMAALVATLQDFGRRDWTLVDRARMSTAYTPVAHKLITAENHDKWQTLEDLVALCWAKRSDTADGIEEVAA